MYKGLMPERSSCWIVDHVVPEETMNWIINNFPRPHQMKIKITMCGKQIIWIQYKNKGNYNKGNVW